MNVSGLKPVHKGLPLIRVMPEWGSPGLWAPPLLAGEACGGCLEPRDLPAEFTADLRAWQERFDEGDPAAAVEPDEAEWLDTVQLDLTIRLSVILGAAAYVQADQGFRMPTFLNGRCVAMPARRPTRYADGVYSYGDEPDAGAS